MILRKEGSIMLKVRYCEKSQTFWIPRPDPETVAHLDKTMIREPGCLRWRKRYDPAEVQAHPLAELRNIAQGEEVFVIGKGPSEELLDQTRVRHAIYLNHACMVHPMPGYVVIQDAPFSRGPVSDGIVPPDNVSPVVPAAGAHTYPGKVKYLYESMDRSKWQAPEAWDQKSLPYGPLSFHPALYLAGCVMGAKRVVAVGCDGESITTGPAYSPRFAGICKATRASDHYSKEYGLAKREAARLGIEIVWFHRQKHSAKLKKSKEVTVDVGESS